MAGMDAVSLLENSGLRVKLIGNGTVATQSINKGEAFKNGQQITLSLK
jgi:cell division protein FtsI (penicillin-binding protein 3)